MPDAADRCPHAKETLNGYKDDDGCPDVYPLVFQGDRIRLRQRVTFVGETAALSADARQLLTTLALALRQRPQILLTEIQGHLAPTTAPAYGRRLALQRARSVKDFLVRSGGISRLRLTARGYGATRPLCLDRTPACGKLNERIELHIVWQGDRRQRPAMESEARRGALLPARHAASLTRSAALRLQERHIRKLYEAGLRSLRKGRYTAAFQRLRAVVRLRPDHLQARLKLGVLQARLGDHAGANDTVRWVRNHVGDDAADKLRQAQLDAMNHRRR